jgi:hypothetical protein
MPFTNWDPYLPLLDSMAEQRSAWESAADFASFDAAVRQNCPGLLGGEDTDLGAYGYESLTQELQAALGNPNLVFAQIKLVALASPAAALGLGPEWQGYFIGNGVDGREMYAPDRFADPSGWAPVEVGAKALSLTHDAETGLMYDSEHWYLADGKTIVTEDPDQPGAFKDSAGNVYIKGELQQAMAPAPGEQQFDAQTGRWRRAGQDGEFEYYHADDGVWERSRQVGPSTMWHRYHGERFGWLPYDQASGKWLDPTTQNTAWRGYEEVGKPVAEPQGTGESAAARAQVSDSAEPDDLEEDEEFDEETEALIAEEYEKNVQEAIANVRKRNVTAEMMSDEAIRALFDDMAPSS